MTDVLLDLALPRTDAGAIAQASIWLTGLAVVLALVRHEREWRTLVAGVLVLSVALFALRTLH